MSTCVRSSFCTFYTLVMIQIAYLIFSEPCLNPMTSVFTPYITVDVTDKTPSGADPRQVLLGSELGYKLPSGATTQTFIFDIAAKDNPRLNDFSFLGVNINADAVILTVGMKGSTERAIFNKPVSFCCFVFFWDFPIICNN